jgi:hypothetical protein
VDSVELDERNDLVSRAEKTKGDVEMTKQYH